MREIIHIQAGRLSNFVGTHYFNTLESYFSSAAGGEGIAHNVSFREGLAPDGSETFCPRLLLFDFKENFGALSSVSALYNDGLEEEDTTAWDGFTEINRQPRIERNDYQLSLEKEESGLLPHDTAPPMYPHTVKHWSDFNRVYHAPRSLHPLKPPISAGTSVSGTSGHWDEGAEFFRREDADSEILESDFRHFVEECDLLQGLHVMFDVSTFASFTLGMLGLARDELPKVPILTIPNLGIAPTRQPNVAYRTLTEAQALRELSDISYLTVPLQSPSSWKLDQWSSLLDADFTSPYHSSAILAAHVESATLPLRLQRSDVDMRQFCDCLQSTDNSRFAQMCGAIPAISSLDEKQFSQMVHDFSTPTSPSDALFSQWSVVRGFNDAEYAELEQHLDILRHPLARSTTTALPYPLPTSYPQFFDNRLLTSTGRLKSEFSHRKLPFLPSESPPSPKKPRLTAAGDITTTLEAMRLTSVPMYSAFRTTPALGRFFSTRVAFMDDVLKSGSDYVHALGPAFGRDEMKELREELARIAETCPLDSQGNESDGGDMELDI